VKKKPTPPPTNDEIQSASKNIKSFNLFKTGQNIVPIPLDKESVIAYIEFVKFKDLSKKDEDDLNFLSTFLHKSKKFISPVALNTCSWGCLMYAIGWRKSPDENQIVGNYIKKI
jgi:hypothetical protein